jgi:high-affinity iron transporter
MFESLVIMLREGVEAALVIGIILVVLRRTGRRALERPVYLGLAWAVAASVAAAVAITRLPVNQEAYEGVLYIVSALFVGSMMVWMHRNARTLRRDIETRVEGAVEIGRPGGRGALALGAFAFFMVFREGAETVLFLSAVRLTTDSLLGFLGAGLGLAGAVAFGVSFVRGNLQVDLRRFFFVTEWVLGIFLFQLLVNGYHEFAEAGVAPATRESMALVGPIVRNNSLFVLALVAIPLFIWLSRRPAAEKAGSGASRAERRLLAARARRENAYRAAGVAAVFTVLGVVGIAYARELVPREIPPPEPVGVRGTEVAVPLERLEDGKLHRLGYPHEGRLVRFLAMKSSDGAYHAALDACEICGPLGYMQEGDQLLCLNCEAEINPLTLGLPGGCNPIPLEFRVGEESLLVPVGELDPVAPLFEDEPEFEDIDPVCGMRVTMSGSAAILTHEGRTYYFCSRRCEEQFRANPEDFTR